MPMRGWNARAVFAHARRPDRRHLPSAAAPSVASPPPAALPSPVCAARGAATLRWEMVSASKPAAGTRPDGVYLLSPRGQRSLARVAPPLELAQDAPSGLVAASFLKCAEVQPTVGLGDDDL